MIVSETMHHFCPEDKMFRLYIGGRCVEGKGGSFEVENPATEEVVAGVLAADEAQAAEALDAAQHAFKDWSGISLAERAAWMLKLRDGLLADREEMVDLVAREVGKPHTEAKAEFELAIAILDMYREESKRIYGTVLRDYSTQPGQTIHMVRRHPVGVVVGHLAWNYPLQNIALKLGPSMASGCTCVLKPSIHTPLSALRLGAIAESVGLPEGVFNVVAGPSSVVGKALNESRIPRLITVIGSSETGRSVMAQAATSIKRFSLELGGNAPAVVMPDADLESAAAFMVGRKRRCCGQGCANINRIYVHESIRRRFVDLLGNEARKIKVGWGKELGDVMGSQIHKAARNRLLELVQDATDKGARLVYGGTIPDQFPRGAFIMPTVLDDVEDGMRLRHEEIFGPLLPVYAFENLDEVIAKANDTPYGLTAYLFSHDSRIIARISEEIECGEILVNNPGGANFAPLPHIGIKESGVGCDGSFWSLEAYLSMRRVSIRP